MKQTGSYKQLVQWIVGVLLVTAGLHQAVAVTAWQAAAPQQLVEQVQQQYAPYQAQALYQQLEPLAQAAGVQPTDVQTLQSRVASSADIALTGKEIAQLPMAGTEMKEQVQQQLDEKGIAANEEISALMDTLEQEGNRLEQQAWQLPAANQLQSLMQQVQQRQAWLPSVLIAGVLVVAGLVLLALLRRAQPVFVGLAIAGILAHNTIRISFARMQIPAIDLGQTPAADMLNKALVGWLLPVKAAAGSGALVLAVGALVIAILLAVQMIWKRKVR